MKLLRKLVAWLCVAVAIYCFIVAICSCFAENAALSIKQATFGLIDSAVSWGWLGWVLWGLLFLAIGYIMDPTVAKKFVEHVSTAASEVASDIGKGAVSILDSVASALGGSSTLWLIAICVGGYLVLKSVTSKDSGTVVVAPSAPVNQPPPREED